MPSIRTLVAAQDLKAIIESNKHLPVQPTVVDCKKSDCNPNIHPNSVAISIEGVQQVISDIGYLRFARLEFESDSDAADWISFAIENQSLKNVLVLKPRV